MANRKNIFGLPPGIDFPREFVAGLLARYGDLPAENFARIRIIVNSRRMGRRIRAELAQDKPLLLPRFHLVTALSEMPEVTLPAKMCSKTARLLEIAPLVAKVQSLDKKFSGSASVFDLSKSLVDLIDEMQGEGIEPDALDVIDLEDASEHWQTRRQFIQIVLNYLEHSPNRDPDPELVQRLALEAIRASWKVQQPNDPVLVVGSTGSRDTTAQLIASVAKLPTGSVILPGLDTELPEAAWDVLAARDALEDHPQYRIAHLARFLQTQPSDISSWTDQKPPSPNRNALISLSLRPAPITHVWLSEGPKLEELPDACSKMSLIEASNPRIEALAIALRMRHAIQDQKTVALITPDRMLARRVTGELDRWRIVPDDSAGVSLLQTALGRFLHQILGLFDAVLTSESSLILLKNPLTNSTAADRGTHLILTREFELALRRSGPAFVSDKTFRDWADRTDVVGAEEWAGWAATLLCDQMVDQAEPLSFWITKHREIAERLAAGEMDQDSDRIWSGAEGEAAHAMFDALAEAGDQNWPMSAWDYRTLIESALRETEIRIPFLPRSDVMIWGTLEARAQGADVVILGGLNEGVWPATPQSDPWVNRDIRRQTGMLMPDRRIGLSAHDYQQAMGASEVVLSRSRRDADAETVPSRWLNRLTNLLNGLPEDGPQALESMKERGGFYTGLAKTIDERAPVMRTPRPAPSPPLQSRPKRLSVTQIQTLIRDPYAIYAREILRLERLDTLRPIADARIKGLVLHKIFDRFFREPFPDDLGLAEQRLFDIATGTLQTGVLWPVAQKLWLAALHRISGQFLAEEQQRQSRGKIALREEKGQIKLSELDFTLVAKADRVDHLNNGTLAVFDYKTGQVPTEKTMIHFDKQLMLEAMIAEEGGFSGLPATSVSQIAHIGLGASSGEALHQIGGDKLGSVQSARDELVELLSQYLGSNIGFSSRRAPQSESFFGDYDHLARAGEWTDSETPTLIELT